MSRDNSQIMPLLRPFNYSYLGQEPLSGSDSFRSKDGQSTGDESRPQEAVSNYQPDDEDAAAAAARDVMFSPRGIKVKLDHTKSLAWISFIVFLLIVSATIIVLAEFERIEHLMGGRKANHSFHIVRFVEKQPSGRSVPINGESSRP